MPLNTLEFRIDPSHWKRMQAFHAAERKAGMPYGPQRDLFERRCDTHYLCFLGETAHRVAHVCEVYGLNRVLLLGPRRYTGIIEDKLSPFLRKQTVQIPHLWCEWNSSMSLTRVEETLCRFEAAYQERYLSELLNRGSSVVTGAEETLAMLQRGRLGFLFAEESFNPLLRYCKTCDHVSASSAQECPRCRGGIVDLTLHEILPQLLIRHHCESHFLSGRNAESLRSVGSIGGWLRQRQPLSSAEPQLQRQPGEWLAAGMP